MSEPLSASASVPEWQAPSWDEDSDNSGRKPSTTLADVGPQAQAKALDALGEITGETMSEKVIDEVFARFCVGK